MVEVVVMLALSAAYGIPWNQTPGQCVQARRPKNRFVVHNTSRRAARGWFTHEPLAQTTTLWGRIPEHVASCDIKSLPTYETGRTGKDGHRACYLAGTFCPWSLCPGVALPSHILTRTS